MFAKIFTQLKFYALAVCLVSMAGSAHAQKWEPVNNNQWFDGQVLSLYADDANNVLYAGGTFTKVDGVTVNGIAMWDGTQWKPMGDGFNGGQPYVYWITKYKNDIYAAGAFRGSGTDSMHGIAKWNGTKWESVGGSIVFATQYDNVAAMYEFNNELYVGGRFDSVGAQSVSNIAKWDGTKWTAVGTSINDDVVVIKEHDNELYIGGYFVFAAQTGIQYRIAKLSGNKFVTVGTKGLGDATARWGVETLVTYKGDLYAGGYFNVLEDGTVKANNIARWDGSKWNTVEGTDAGVAASSVNPVRSLVAYKGRLFVGGHFSAAGGASPVGNIATWDGSKWGVLGTGTDDMINSMTVYNGKLVVAGAFKNVEGQNYEYIAQYSETTGLEMLSNKNAARIYPNPVTGNKFAVSNVEYGAKYELYDMIGKLVDKGTISDDGTIAVKEEVPAGNYSVHIVTKEKEQFSQKISILR